METKYCNHCKQETEVNPFGCNSNYVVCKECGKMKNICPRCLNDNNHLVNKTAESNYFWLDIKCNHCGNIFSNIKHK